MKPTRILRFVQIAATGFSETEYEGGSFGIFALDTDGRVWFRHWSDSNDTPWQRFTARGRPEDFTDDPDESEKDP